ncbi:MaoC/PaaZ C-terminal domain-containing protein [Parahaliea mediterranea]|uniref:MaoC family dehydratase N-terminal domain-containing protein n=1 Tax=Parahaliea mediterranea TaxID=651086 RepID=A0A939DFN6_9GAMM|nr:MaoC/PaaZ C-terminal domain-containing protein [Parahaliea mediterranea]MBN7797378.1 MaoC family dehydratase N-terminal domain-containing protein [Parahaliea mediterranea]
MQRKPYIRSRWWEDIPVGEFHVFGSHTFSELEIIEFGERYAPEIYHTDPVAARDTLHRGLVASGWHLTATWMRLMVDYMERFARGVRDGRRNGAGMGLEDLEWFVPVRPGHTITFTYEITEKPERVVRDRWGIIRSRNEAYNQYNELVMRFNIDILAERNPGVEDGGALAE